MSLVEAFCMPIVFLFSLKFLLGMKDITLENSWVVVFFLLYFLLELHHLFLFSFSFLVLLQTLLSLYPLRKEIMLKHKFLLLIVFILPSVQVVSVFLMLAHILFFIKKVLLENFNLLLCL